MNTKNVLLGVCVILTLIFASLAVAEYGQVSTSIATTTMPTTTTQTATLPVTTTTTSTTTLTATQTVTTTTPTAATTQQVYDVVFQQLGACSNPEFWGVPWSVTIGNTTEVQPPGTPLPISNSTLYGTTNKNLTVITFSLPDGSYHFRVSPSYEFFTPDSGTIDVNGTDVLVQIAYSGTSCTTTVVTGMSTTTTTATSPASSSTVTQTVTTSTTPVTTTANKNTISLSGFSIATGSTGLGEPSPYLSGYINVNASAGVTWSSYALYTNGTYCGTRDFDTPTTMNQFTYSFQGSPCGTVMAGDAYLITFVVTFTDGTDATASVSVIAD